MIVLQGYGATETAAGSATTMDDHPLGCVGWPPKPVEMRIVDDGEIQFRGPRSPKGYWNNPEATAAAFTEDGWYKSGDLGQLDEEGRLHLHGRKKDMFVLPNGFNVYPEDIENALRVAGIRDSVAVETRPGRIEVVVLAPGTHADPRDQRATSAIEGATPEDLRREIEAAVKAANASLGPNQRIAGWRLWPEADFPRTHTFKVKRDRVRTWATIDSCRGRAERRGAARASGRGPRASGAIAFSTRRALVSGLLVPSTLSVNTRRLLYERPSKNAFAPRVRVERRRELRRDLEHARGRCRARG